MDALAVDILIIFKRDVPNGWEFLFRWAHVLGRHHLDRVALLLQLRAGAGVRRDGRGGPQQRRSTSSRRGRCGGSAGPRPRPLVFGILILGGPAEGHRRRLAPHDSDYWKTAPGISIATGILLGVTMFVNVWLVIWPNQKIVIANARNVQAGGEADPDAAAAGRKAAAGLAPEHDLLVPDAGLHGRHRALLRQRRASTSPTAASGRIYWVITLVDLARARARTASA